MSQVVENESADMASSHSIHVGSSVAQGNRRPSGFEKPLSIWSSSKDIQSHVMGRIDVAQQVDVMSLAPGEERVWFIDWMRSIAIYLVVAVHIVVSARRITDVSPEMDAKVDATFRSLLQYGMPMFFYFSGRASCLSKDNFPVFLYKKVMRLVLPLGFGLILIVIPTSYIGRSYRPCAAADIDNIFEYFVDYFENQFTCGGFEWLWFLPVLFVYAVVNFPLFQWMKRRYEREQTKLLSQDDAIYLPIIGLIIGIFVVLSYTILSIPWTWACLCALPYALNILMMLALPYIRASEQLGAVFLTSAVPSLIMAYLMLDTIEIDELQAALSFYNLFYIQGFIDHLFYYEYRIFKKKKIHLQFRPISLIALIFFLALCCPSTEGQVGYLYTYPLYLIRFNRVTYVLGTWLYLIIFIRWGQSYYNETLSRKQYKHGMRSTIIVYLVHWLFIEVIQVVIVRPANMSFEAAVLLEVPLTILCCWLFYTFVSTVPYVGLLFGFSKPKKRRAEVVEMSAEQVNARI